MRCPFCDAKLYSQSDNKNFKKCSICFLSWGMIDDINLDADITKKIKLNVKKQIKKLKDFHEYGLDDYNDTQSAKDIKKEVDEIYTDCLKCESNLYKVNLKSENDFFYICNNCGTIGIEAKNINKLNNIVEEEFIESSFSFINHIENRNVFKKIFFPIYTEINLYLISLSMLLVYFFYEQGSDLNFGNIVFETMFKSISTSFIGIGFFFSIYHVFRKKKKDAFARGMILIYIITVNYFLGLSYLLKSDAMDLFTDFSFQLFLNSIIPILHFLYGTSLLLMTRFEVIDERTISNKDASLLEVLVATIILVSLFLFTNILLQIDMIVSFSLLVAYSSLLYNFSMKLVFDIYRYMINFLKPE